MRVIWKPDEREEFILRLAEEMSENPDSNARTLIAKVMPKMDRPRPIKVKSFSEELDRAKELVKKPQDKQDISQVDRLEKLLSHFNDDRIKVLESKAKRLESRIRKLEKQQETSIDDKMMNEVPLERLAATLLARLFRDELAKQEKEKGNV